MIEDAFLHHFITEDLFLIKELEQAPAEEKKTPAEEGQIPLPPAPAKIHYPLVILSQSLSDSERVLLGKILGAIKFDLALVPIYQSIPADIDFDVLISFGINDTSIPAIASLASFTPMQIETRTLLKSRPLTELQGNDELKKQLWSALKQIFQNK